MAPEATLGTTWAPNQKQHHIATVTGLVFGSIWESFWTPKSVIVGIDLVIFLMMCFLSLLEGFGVDFGAILMSKSDKNAKYRYMRNRCFIYVKTMCLRLDGVNPGSKCVQNWSLDSKTFRV